MQASTESTKHGEDDREQQDEVGDDELITDSEGGEDFDAREDDEAFASFVGGSAGSSGYAPRPRQASSGLDPVFLLRDFFRVFAPSRVDEARPLVEEVLAGAASRAEGKSGEELETAEEEALLEMFASIEASYGAAANGFFSEERFRLCFSSAFFEPLRALYDASALPPYPFARPLDNIHKAQLLLPNGSLTVGKGADDGDGDGEGEGEGVSLPVISAARGAGSSLAKSLMPHLAPRTGILHTKEKAERDRAWRQGGGAISASHLGQLAKSLEAVAREGGPIFGGGGEGAGAGPLGSLSRWFAERRRLRLLICVPVLTSSSSSSRSHYQRVRTAVVTGRIGAVDAHWNLLLLGGDCRVVWLPGTRRVKRPEFDRDDDSDNQSGAAGGGGGGGGKLPTEEDTGERSDGDDDENKDSDSDSIVADTSVDASSAASSSSLLLRAANRQALEASPPASSSSSSSSTTARGGGVAPAPAPASTTTMRQMIIKGEWIMSVSSVQQHTTAQLPSSAR